MTVADEKIRMSGVRHLFTVDVEEYFQVQALEPFVTRESWERRPSRVARGTDLILELLDRFETRATFFILGWVASKHPELVRRIAAAGHEVASHGWSHTRVCELTPDAFRKEARDSKRCLEDLSGAAVLGFRAPSFSIVPASSWAIDIIREEGYEYDSSLFPIRRPGYGYPGAHFAPFIARRPGGDLIEVPPATLNFFRLRIPAGGGGYLRQFPLGISRMAYRLATERGTPATLYVHPWEVDEDQPRVSAPLLTRIRHYRGIGGMAGRLERLLAEFSFTSISEWLESQPSAIRTLPVREIG